MRRQIALTLGAVNTLTLMLLGTIVAVVFAGDAANRWWRDNKWRYHRHDTD